MMNLLKIGGVILLGLGVLGALSGGSKNEAPSVDPGTSAEGTAEAPSEDASAPEMPTGKVSPAEDIARNAEVMEINLAKKLGPATQRASGFLASISATEPSTELVQGVKPGLFRVERSIGKTTYPRITSLQAIPQMVPSYPLFKGPGSGNFDTWYATWEKYLRETLDETIARKETWQWDIWNEPNWPSFWNGTRGQYLETWKRSYRLIREKIPGAVITGPSAAYYDKSFLNEFLLYAKDNGVLPNVLTWHELLPSSPESIPARVAEIKDFMEKNGIGIQRIQLNEITAQSHQFRPGHIVWFFAAIERSSGIEAAAKSCWLDGFGHNCVNNSLNGLLTSGKPRSAYWAYKAYADVTGDIIEVKPSRNFDGVAGVGNGAVRMIVGNHGKTGNLAVRLNGFSDSKDRRVRAFRIVNSERDPSGWPAAEIDKILPVMNGSLVVNIPDMKEWEAVYLEIRP